MPIGAKIRNGRIQKFGKTKKKKILSKRKNRQNIVSRFNVVSTVKNVVTTLKNAAAALESKKRETKKIKGNQLKFNGIKDAFTLAKML